MSNSFERAAQPHEHHLSSPAELGEIPLRLSTGDAVAIENYGATEAIEWEEWEYPSGAIVNGRPILRITTHPENGEEETIRFVDFQYSPSRSGATYIGDEYDHTTPFRPGKLGLVVMAQVGQLRDIVDEKTRLRGIVARGRYGLLVSDQNGQLTGFFGELDRGSSWEHNGVSVSIGDNLELDEKLVITNNGVNGTVEVTPHEATSTDSYSKPNFDRLFVPINGGIPRIAADPVTGEDYFPPKKDRHS